MQLHKRNKTELSNTETKKAEKEYKRIQDTSIVNLSKEMKQRMKNKRILEHIV